MPCVAPSEMKDCYTAMPHRISSVPCVTPNETKYCYTAMPHQPYYSLGGSHSAEPHVVAMDCEMVGVKGDTEGIVENALCKVSLVTLALGRDGYCFRTLLNTWVTVENEVIDYRTAITGINAETMRKLPSIPLQDARDTVRRLVDGKNHRGSRPGQ